jgi:tetratricopeptide (TPR) repeat protein
MTLDLGDMTLKMAAFGPGTHTGDDIVVHVPELDLVATGDLFFAGALQFVFRLEEGLDIEKKLAVLDEVLADEGLQHVVTVHNGISSRDALARWRDYMRWVWDAVDETAEAGGTLDDVRAKLNLDDRYPDPAALGLDPEAIAGQHRNGVPVVWMARAGGRDASVEIAGILDDGGIEAARTFFAAAVPLRDERFLIDEISFNLLGYRLLGEGRNEEAVAVFEMNVELFPDSWNVHDSLGEALAATGQTERALASYRRSVELNPENVNGQGWIERLEAGE